MSSPVSSTPERNVARIAFVYFAVLLVAWSGAWLLYAWLREQNALFNQPLNRFLYWLVMRVLLWVVPSLKLIRLSGRGVREVLGFDRARAILLWGGITGLIWGGRAPLFQWLAGRPLHPIVFDWSFVTAVIYVPLVEEITFRGAIMGALQTRMNFAPSNLITGVLFLLIHFPSWYFEGVFASGLMSSSSAVLGILLLGFLFGYVSHRSKSVAAATLSHMLNNLFQRFVN